MSDNVFTTITSMCILYFSIAIKEGAINRIMCYFEKTKDYNSFLGKVFLAFFSTVGPDSVRNKIRLTLALTYIVFNLAIIVLILLYKCNYYIVIVFHLVTGYIFVFISSKIKNYKVINEPQ